MKQSLWRRQQDSAQPYCALTDTERARVIQTSIALSIIYRLLHPGNGAYKPTIGVFSAPTQNINESGNDSFAESNTLVLELILTQAISFD